MLKIDGDIERKTVMKFDLMFSRVSLSSGLHIFFCEKINLKSNYYYFSFLEALSELIIKNEF